jgi:fructose-bisphosphate aldolase, class II
MASANLREKLQQAHEGHYALGHFNFSELVVLKAVAAAARDLATSVVVGVSESEREFVGVGQAAALVKSFREESSIDIFLNADHAHSLEKAAAAAKAGFDMVVFDLSKRSFDENVRQTRAAVETLKSIHPSIIVEGEIGYIGTSSAIHAAIPYHLLPAAYDGVSQVVR